MDIRIKLPLSRLVIEMIINYWLPWLDKVTTLHLNDAAGEEGRLNAAIIQSLYKEVKGKILAKRYTPAKKPSITLIKAEAIVLYKLLLSLPLPETEVWQQLQRQIIINLLDAEIKNT
jgi:hypothetical protein